MSDEDPSQQTIRSLEISFVVLARALLRLVAAQEEVQPGWYGAHGRALSQSIVTDLRAFEAAAADRTVSTETLRAAVKRLTTLMLSVERSVAEVSSPLRS